MKARPDMVSFFRQRPESEHVPLHRLWAFAKHWSTLEVSEDGHVKACAECRKSLQACLQENSFGAVLKQLRLAQEAPAESQVKPKLTQLYVFAGRIE